ncbi:MAG: hydratase [Actinomycetota bacterium]|jgi:2-keto-4-pentenoate hydratase|nr:hydratase [Actinomycetota bacterium]
MSGSTGSYARGVANTIGRAAWSADRADQAAEVLWQAWQRGELIDHLPADCTPGSMEEGHAVQARLAERTGSRFGWKIAATSTAGQRHIAVDRPLAGRLFTRYVVEDGSRVSVSAGHMHMLVAEAEFAFRVGSGGELADEMYLAIELPDSRFARFEVAGGPQLVADNACGSRFVLGPAVPGWRQVDLVEQAVVVKLNGDEAAVGAGGNVMSGPFETLAWLANELTRYNETLLPGDIVTTGVAALPVPVRGGDHVVAEFPSLGSVSVRFDP